MKTTTYTHQNSKTYSDGMKLCLSLDLSISIDTDDPMWSFLDAVEGETEWQSIF